MTERFQVGVIASTHGLRGEVKVFPTTDDPGRFLDLDEVILDAPQGERILRIRSVKFFKKFVILGFQGLDRIEDVERLRGCPLVVDRKDALPLEEGEYYVADLRICCFLPFLTVSWMFSRKRAISQSISCPGWRTCDDLSRTDIVS